MVDGVEIRGWDSYDIKTSITDPCHTFTLQRPFDREVWDRCREDRVVRVRIDGVPIVTGRIDDRKAPPGEYVVQITGRCNVGRLMDDAVPSMQFGGLGMQEIITNLASEFFQRVTFSGARDRNVRRGKGKKARAGNEPLELRSRKGTAAVEPGQKIWQVIADLLEQANLLAWSSGDGTELIIATPNYNQEPQFRFFRPSPNSKRANESTCLEMGVERSTGDRYSRVIVVGSGAGTTVNFGDAVASRFGQAKNNPLTVDGDGLDFTAPKRLVVQSTIASNEEAREVAEREMAKRDASGLVVPVRCAGHGQRVGGLSTTLFACDLMALVEHEPTGTRGAFTITSCGYSQTRGGGAETTMTLVPRGTVLA